MLNDTNARSMSGVLRWTVGGGRSSNSSGLNATNARSMSGVLKRNEVPSQ